MEEERMHPGGPDPVKTPDEKFEFFLSKRKIIFTKSQSQIIQHVI
jgi:hypothetical protein